MYQLDMLKDESPLPVRQKRKSNLSQCTAEVEEEPRPTTQARRVSEHMLCINMIYMYFLSVARLG
jgi:hypothetical protein